MLAMKRARAAKMTGGFLQKRYVMKAAPARM